MIKSIVPEDNITLDMLSKINYDLLERKYNIHKYYPRYIHNSHVSTPVLRDLIVDKPIYKDANKHVKKCRAVRTKLLKQNYEKKLRNLDEFDLGDIVYDKYKARHFEFVEADDSRHRSDNETVDSFDVSDTYLLDKRSLRSQKKMLHKEQHQQRKQLKQEHREQRKQLKNGGFVFNDSEDPYKKQTARQANGSKPAPQGRVGRNERNGYGSQNGNSVHTGHTIHIGHIGHVGHIGHTGPTGNTGHKEADDIQFRNPFDEYDNNLTKLSNYSISSKERRSSSIVSKRNNSIASKFFNFMRQSQDELRETPPSSSHSPDNITHLVADHETEHKQRSGSFDQTKSAATGRRWNMFKKVTDRRGSFNKIGTYA